MEGPVSARLSRACVRVQWALGGIVMLNDTEHAVPEDVLHVSSACHGVQAQWDYMSEDGAGVGIGRVAAPFRSRAGVSGVVRVCSCWKREWYVAKT